jgi:DcmR-like sensory protein
VIAPAAGRRSVVDTGIPFVFHGYTELRQNFDSARFFGYIAWLEGDAMSTRTGYRHEALLYRGAADFEDKVSRFLREGARLGEPMLVAVCEPRLGGLRAALAGERDLIEFVDMAELGANPAAIIPRWLRFVESAGGRPVRGVGEPIWCSRSPAELLECQLHEALLNLAVPEETPFRLLCPYDETALSQPVLGECEATHPWIGEEEPRRPSRSYAQERVQALLRSPLGEPPAAVPALTVRPADVHQIYAWLREQADELGADAGRGRLLAAVMTDLVEENVLTDDRPVRLRIWRDDERMVGEVCTDRPLDDPLLGRRAAAAAGPGRALWLANHICDLTQVRGDERGTVLRVHARA